MLTILGILIIAGIVLFIPAIIAIIVIACVKADNKKRRETQGYYVNGQFIPPVQPEQYATPKPPKPPREKLSASAIMLLIGTAFIVLAATTFVAANWLDMSPIGRVFALLAESGIAFGISTLLKKVIKLNRTSMSFYMIGSIVAVISLITAGYYELFGSWLACEGDGFALLYAVCAVIVSASAILARKLYDSKAFNYIAVSFMSVAVVFLCIQPTEYYKEFAVVIAVAQTGITAVIHFMKPHKDTEMERPITIVGDISAVVYQILAGVHVLGTTFAPDFYTFAVLVILLAQLCVYGLLKNQKWLFIFFNIVGIYTGFVISGITEDKIGESNSMILFAFITLAFYIANRFIPNNLTASHVISLIGAVLGSIVSLCAGSDINFVLNLVVPAATSLGIVSYTLNKDNAVQTASGLVSPILPFFMALFVNSKLDSSYESRTFVFGLLVTVYVAVSAFFIFMPQLNFEFHAKHPVRSQTVIYANMVCAVAVLFNISGYSKLFMIPVALCIAHFVISYSMSCNITAVGSVASLIHLVNSVLKECADYGDARLYIMFMLFVVLIVISRIIFPDGFTVRKDDKTRIDVILLSAWTAVIPMLDSSKMSTFLFLISIAVFIAGFIKRNTPSDTACMILSFSATIAWFAFMTRPFLKLDYPMIENKVNIAIFMILGVAYRLIWKNHPYGSKAASTVVFILSFAALIIDGIGFDNVANRIFVLAVTTGVLVFSFFVKSKTWFLASSIALVIITLFSTIRYFNSAGWWLYLLVVGVVLIVIASINEGYKKKGESMKSTVAKKFSDWTW